VVLPDGHDTPYGDASKQTFRGARPAGGRLHNLPTWLFGEF
jgi:hypothetical protein